MNARELAEYLREVALKSGVAKDEDFEGVDALGIIASYTVALSGGRITEDRDILARVAGCGNIDHWINSVSRKTIPVPSRTQIEAVRDGRLNEYTPAPPEPTMREKVADACRRYLIRDKKSTYHYVMGEVLTPAIEQDLERALKATREFDNHRSIATFVNDHGVGAYPHGGHLGTEALINRVESPEQFIKIVTGKERE